MSKVLKSTILYRFEDLDSAVMFAETQNDQESDEGGKYSLVKYTIEHKTPKEDDFFVVTLVKDYTK